MANKRILKKREKADFELDYCGIYDLPKPPNRQTKSKKQIRKRFVARQLAERLQYSTDWKDDLRGVLETSV
jgi:hypothetical protein